MTKLEALKAQDFNRALYTEYSTLTDGVRDYWCNGADKIGRRHIMQMKTTNDNGVEISIWMYQSKLTKAIKSGALKVLRK